jgi:hypothetical protein
MNKIFLFNGFENIRPEHLKKHSSGAWNAALVPFRNRWGAHLAKPCYGACAAEHGNHFGVRVYLIHSPILAIATLVVNSHSYLFF